MTDQDRPARGPDCPPRMMIDDFANGRLADRPAAENRIRTHIATCVFACPSDELSFQPKSKSTSQGEKPSGRFRFGRRK